MSGVIIVSKLNWLFSLLFVGGSGSRGFSSYLFLSFFSLVGGVVRKAAGAWNTHYVVGELLKRNIKTVDLIRSCSSDKYNPAAFSILLAL